MYPCAFYRRQTEPKRQPVVTKVRDQSGFSDTANLDEGNMWPTAFALKKLTTAEEARMELYELTDAASLIKAR